MARCCVCDRIYEQYIFAPRHECDFTDYRKISGFDRYCDYLEKCIKCDNEYCDNCKYLLNVYNMCSNCEERCDECGMIINNDPITCTYHYYNFNICENCIYTTFKCPVCDGISCATCIADDIKCSCEQE
jgi:hypothetical protein